MNQDQTIARTLLVRHGETADNATGLVQGQGGGRLSALGRQQALATGARLRGAGIAVIYTSDQIRAQETAGVVAAALGLNLVISDARLREQGFGAFEGGSVRQLMRAMVKAGADFTSFNPEGGEPAGVFRLRVAGLLKELATRHPGETVLLVTHHGFIRMTQRLARERWREKAPATVANGSITVAAIDRSGVLSVCEYGADFERETEHDR